MDTPNEQQLLTMAAARNAELLDGRLVLYAGANLPSVGAQAAYSPALSAYPAMGRSFFKEQPDTDLVSHLEEAVSAEIRQLFGAGWAEPRLPSCTIANLAVFHAFSRPGDLLLAPAAAHGGHLSQRRGGTPELAGLQVEDLPFDGKNCCLDASGAAAMVLERRPRMIMLGRSIMIKPDDIAPVVAACREVGAKTIFDASHVSGLIVGGTFPNPLTLGVDIITSSTYKTLPGRPHSLIAGRDPADGERLADLIDRQLLANYDAGKLPSLLVTLRQAAAGGRDLAERICRNSWALAGALVDGGVHIIAPVGDEAFTHQLLVPMDLSMTPAEAIKALERKAILVGTCADPTTPGSYALRIGTQFVTNQGGGIKEMKAAAALLSSVLRGTSKGRMAIAV